MYRALQALVAMLVFGSATGVLAQAPAYPTKPIRLIVPYPAGGTAGHGSACTCRAGPDDTRCHRRRKPPGRGRKSRRRPSREIPRRWLHACHRRGCHARGEPLAVPQAPVRPGERLRADHVDRACTQRAGDNAGARRTTQHCQRARLRRISAQASGTAQLRLRRQRQRGPYGRGIAEVASGGLCGAHTVRRRGSGATRAAGRPDRFHVRQPGLCAGADPRRQAQGAGGHDVAARSGTARCADDGRKWPARVRRIDLVRRLCAGRHARASGRQGSTRP